MPNPIEVHIYSYTVEIMINNVNILLVDDETADLQLMQKMFSKSKVPHNVILAHNGDEALEILRKSSSEQDVPDLILLDINMPGKDGNETLKIIKLDQYLRTIPVIMLTSSTNEQDVLNSYRDYANAYIQKPVGAKAMSEVIKKIEDFWFGLVIAAKEKQQAKKINSGKLFFSSI